MPEALGHNVAHGSQVEVSRSAAEAKLASVILKLCAPDMFPATDADFEKLIDDLNGQKAYTKNISESERWEITFNLVSELKDFFDNNL